MSKIQRKEQKIFASTSTNDVCVFGSRRNSGSFVYSLDPNEIQNNYFKDGWSSAIVSDYSPLREDWNALDYVLSYNIAYLLQQGIAEWSSDTTYYQGSIISIINIDNAPIIYYSITNDNIGNNPLSDDGTNWKKLTTGGSSRNIGELVTSTIPLTDTGLHLLDGSLIDGTGIYNNFYNYILNLYNSGDYSDIFETEANWQTSVTTYGVCGKFVIDTVNQTVRLPKITGFIEGTNTQADLGKLTEAGLPDHIHTLTTGGQYGSLGVSVGANWGYDTGYSSDTASLDTNNASVSNTVYGNSNTVQPQSIKVLFYVVIATSVKTDIEIDIDEITNDLNNKANKNGSNATFSNLTNTAKQNIRNCFLKETINIDNVSEIEFTNLNDGYQHKFEFINITSTTNAYMLGVLGNSNGYVTTGYSYCLFGKWSQATNQWITDSTVGEGTSNIIITSDHNNYWYINSQASYVNFSIKSDLSINGNQFFEMNSMVNSLQQSGRLMITDGNGMLLGATDLDRIKFYLSSGNFAGGIIKHYIY